MPASNAVLNPSIIAKEALMLLDNNLVMGNLVHRGYEEEFSTKVNGYKKGDTITIRRPARYTIRTGSVASVQDSVEGSTTIVINKQIGVDMSFTSSDMTLKISDFSERFLKSAMITIANQVDQDVAALYANVWNYVGTPGTTLSSFAGFGRAPQRMTEMAIPVADRCAVLSPADKWGLLGGLTANLFIPQDKTVKNALQKAQLPPLGGLDTYETQNVATFTTGQRGGTAVLSSSSQQTTYASAKTTMTQTIATSGWSASTSNVVKAGDVFTISNLYAVNPVTHAVLPYVQQFVCTAAADSDGSGLATITISPPIILSGAYQTVASSTGGAATVTAGKALTFAGSASTSYSQNMAFVKQAFALCMVPMEIPQGAVNGARESYKGLSVRLQPYYDGTNDIDNWRLDVLYGVKAIFPDLAVRIGG